MKKICSLFLGISLSLCVCNSSFASFSAHYQSGGNKIKIGKNSQKYKYNNKSFFYQNGSYYSPVNNNEAILVNPPYGMNVSYIPRGHMKYQANGQEYFIYNNVSYVESPNGGYTIVETPPTAPKMHKQQGLVNSDPANNKYNEYQYKSAKDLAVQIPNGDGTFTTVPIEKTDKGYKGPQGEEYENFPSINDLKDRYGQNKTQAQNQVQTQTKAQNKNQMQMQAHNH